MKTSQRLTNPGTRHRDVIYCTFIQLFPEGNKINLPVKIILAGLHFTKHFATMNWIVLILAGLFEVIFAFCLGKAKVTTGNEMYSWYAGFALALGSSMVLLVKAIQTLPIGTAYAVWTGIGAIGTVLIGIVVFKEPVTFLRLFFISTLIASIVGLKIVSN